jgi:molybdopterin-guanine dinucleotide biosynthesis adapter protein
MLPIFCMVGASGSGKTTLLEKLIPELTRRGYRIGTVKHDVHGFEMDREGKDTWRHRKAGAGTIAISSPSQVATIRGVDGEMGLDELVGRYFWNEDLLIAEGFKRLHFPKIEVFRKAVEPEPICQEGDNLIAMVTDDPVEIDAPVFRFDQVGELAEFIEKRYLADRKVHNATVLLDGKRLPMNDFVRDIFVGTVRGMLSTLRGWQEPGKIDIQIRMKDE